MAVIKTEVPKDLKNRVTEERKKQGCSEADLVRRAVLNYLATDKEKPQTTRFR